MLAARGIVLGLGLVLGLACGSGRDEPTPVTAPPDGAAVQGHERIAVARVVEGSDKPEPVARPAGWVPGPADIPPTHFEGREIATTMSHLGASWLIRPNRDDEEDTTQLHQALGLEPGQTACDVGAGNGYHTVRMARAVGPEGRVLAVDIQPRMLEMLRERVEEAGLSNVETIQARLGSPQLPDGACDLILLVDVYHELAWPEPMLAAFRRALSAKGRLALVEFRAEDPDVPIKLLHKMSKAQIDAELLPRGFVLVHSYDRLPWQHLLFFGRDDRPSG